MQRDWKITSCDDGWAVFRPDGSIRCVVDSYEFAAQIRSENIHEEKLIKANRKKKPIAQRPRRPRPVIDRTTGIIYESIADAAASIEATSAAIYIAIRQDRKCKGHRFERFK